MKITTLLFLGSLLSLSAFAANDPAESDKTAKKSPEDKMLEQIKKDPKTNPETSDTFNSSNLSQFAKDPIFATESPDQKEREKIVEGHQRKFDQSTSSHIQALYECGKIGEAKAAGECRKNVFKPTKKK